MSRGRLAGLAAAGSRLLGLLRFFDHVPSPEHLIMGDKRSVVNTLGSYASVSIGKGGGANAHALPPVAVVQDDVGLYWRDGIVVQAERLWQGRDWREDFCGLKGAHNGEED